MAVPTQVPTVRVLQAVVDARRPLLAQIPTIHLHTSVMAALEITDFTLVTLTDPTSGRSGAAWLIGNADERWGSCPTPWHRTVRISHSAWRSLGVTPPRASGAELTITIPATRLTLKGTLAEQLISADEIGLHHADASRLGIGKWAFLNYNGIPAVCRVRLLDGPADQGFVRIPLYGRLLIGISSWPTGLNPDILVAPYPTGSSNSSGILVGLPWRPPRLQTLIAGCGTLADRAATAALRAPSAVLRTIEATPGEDQALAVRLPAELFPLLGTSPGKQVYIEWGPGNRAIATALVTSGEDPELPPFQIVGDRLTHAARLPAFAEIKIGTATRATLGIPRITVVTVRRRVVPLIVERLNELIVPVSALFAGIAFKAPISPWLLLIAIPVVVMLLVAPLRMRRPDLRRVK